MISAVDSQWCPLVFTRSEGCVWGLPGRSDVSSLGASLQSMLAQYAPSSLPVCQPALEILQPTCHAEHISRDPAQGNRNYQHRHGHPASTRISTALGMTNEKIMTPSTLLVLKSWIGSKHGWHCWHIYEAYSEENINMSDCVSLYVVCDRLTVSHNPIPHLHLPTQGRVLPVVAEDDQSVAGWYVGMSSIPPR